MDHLDVLRRDPQLVGDDLGERRLVALPLGLHREPQSGFAGRVDAQVAAVGHAQAEDVHVLARPGADPLGEERQADPHVGLPGRIGAGRGLGAAAGLLGAQLVVAGDAHRLLQRPRVVAGVVLPAGGRGVRELLRLQQVAHPQFGGVDAQLVGQALDESLDQVHRLGDAERAGVQPRRPAPCWCTRRSPCSGRRRSRRSR